MTRSRRRPGAPRHEREGVTCGGCWRVVPESAIEGFDVPDAFDPPDAPRVRLAFCVECATDLDFQRKAL